MVNVEAPMKIDTDAVDIELPRELPKVGLEDVLGQLLDVLLTL